MKSHPCVKTGGGVSPTSEPTSQAVSSQLQSLQRLGSESLHEPLIQPPTIETRTSALLTFDRCHYVNRRRQQCRLSTSSPDLELCPHHARQHHQRSQRLNDKDANDLLGDLTDFSTPQAVNALLGNLVRQLARKRISRLDAVAIAYVSQLLLGSISSMDRHDAALRAAEDAGTNDFPSRIIFDPPEPISDTARIAAAYPTSDSLRIAASFGAKLPPTLQNTEGRA